MMVTSCQWNVSERYMNVLTDHLTIHQYYVVFFVWTKILVICEKVSWRPWSPSTGQEMVRKEKIAEGQRTVWQRKLEGARTSTTVAVKIRCKTEFRFSSFLSIHCAVIGWKFINYSCTIKIRKITKELNPAVYFVMGNLIEGRLK